MKKIFLILTSVLISTSIFAQINVISPTDASITISPKGIIDNRVFNPTAKLIAIGDSVLFSNVGSLSVVAIGNKAMAKSQNVGYTVAIGEMSMYNSLGGYANVAVGGATLMNNSGYSNTAIGDQVLVNNTSGTLNTALGSNSMKSNINGMYNVAIGSGTLINSKSISNNIAIGKGAMYQINYDNPSNTRSTNMISIGYHSSYNYQTLAGASIFDQGNVIVGNNSFENVIYGRENVTLGNNTLNTAVNTNSNTAIGAYALNKLNNSTANYGSNTSVGAASLSELIYGSYNTGTGIASGNSLVYGEYNTFLGTSSGVIDIPTGDFVYNSMALGSTAKVNTSNKVVIGNSSVGQIGGYASWTNYSDKRLKENIVYTDKLGLKFINSLKPVSYSYIGDENHRRRDGLIAQDVQESIKNLGLDFSGLIQDNDTNKTLNLSYTELVIPLINAVKELSKQNNDLKSEITLLNDEIGNIKVILKNMDSLKSALNK